MFVIPRIFEMPAADPTDPNCGSAIDNQDYMCLSWLFLKFGLLYFLLVVAKWRTHFTTSGADGLQLVAESLYN